MKKKLLSLVCALALTVSLLPAAQALEGDGARAARALASLSLVSGTGSGYDTDADATQEQAAALLVRLLGAEKAARADKRNCGWKEVPRWAWSAVNYCAYQSLIDWSEYRPNGALEAKLWCAMLLRALGYGEELGSDAARTALRIGLISRPLDGTLTRGDLFETAFAALTYPKRDGGTLLDALLTKRLCTAAAVDALKTFSDKFGEYPYESMSSVETQFLQGGMEYPGLAMISDALAPDIYREALVHETAHQWWYAAVGNDEVRYPWLDEGLTEFSTSIFYRENPSYEVDYEKRIADALGAYVLYFDAFKTASSDTSMTRKVCDYESPFEYTYMTYVKGELMFESLRSIIGDEKFFAGLRDYYASYKFKVAKPDDLIGCMEKAAGRNLKGFFDSWTEGKVADFGGLGGK